MLQCHASEPCIPLLGQAIECVNTFLSGPCFPCIKRLVCRKLGKITPCIFLIVEPTVQRSLLPELNPLPLQGLHVTFGECGRSCNKQNEVRLSDNDFQVSLRKHL